MTQVDVTQILLRASAEAPASCDLLYSLVYQELRDIAGRRLWRERPDHTLQATALVNEAYLRMVDQTRCEWRNRVQFLAVAGQAMRRILVDHARSRLRQKRGGGAEKLPLEAALTLGEEGTDATVLALEAALQRFERIHPDKARVVELRFFAGLTQDECAVELGVSSRTVARYWDYAQAWLYREMRSDN
jgi:RNA polymerase sigma factor (TIGR02999 family)